MKEKLSIDSIKRIVTDKCGTCGQKLPSNPWHYFEIRNGSQVAVPRCDDCGDTSTKGCIFKEGTLKH